MKYGFYSSAHMALGVEVGFTRMWEFTWRVSDCEEIVVGLLTKDGGGLVLRGFPFTCSS